MSNLPTYATDDNKMIKRIASNLFKYSVPRWQRASCTSTTRTCQLVFCWKSRCLAWAS